jgi:hypothetical protein
MIEGQFLVGSSSQRFYNFRTNRLSSQLFSCGHYGIATWQFDIGSFAQRF